MKAATIGLSLLCFAAVGCGPSDVREWVPSDHDPPTESTNQQAPRQVAPRASAPRAEGDLAELAWQKNCSVCHGSEGRGDGPQSAMTKPSDLTKAAFQEKMTDDQIKEVIRKGRNKMPAFNLPDRVLDGLVKRIRQKRTP